MSKLTLIGALVLGGLTLGVAAQEKARPTGRRPDVVWITLDALGPDALACYGGDGIAPTPAIDELAARGMVFDHAFAPSTMRLTAILGQLYALTPQVLHDLGGIGPATGAAAWFAESGYKIFGFFTKPILDAGTESVGAVPPRFDFPRRQWEWGSGPDKISTRIDRLLAGRRADESIFVWIHLPWTEPPARRHPGFGADGTPVGHVRAALRYSDNQIQRVIDLFRASHSLENTLVVVTGSRGKPGDEYGETSETPPLDDAHLRIPLIVAGPGIATGRSSAIVQSLDILPTLVDLLGSGALPTAMGDSFKSALTQGGAETVEHGALAEYVPRRNTDPNDATFSLRMGAWRLTEMPRRHASTFSRGGAEADPPSAIRAQLEAALESAMVRDMAAADMWRRGDVRPPRLDGHEGEFYRAAFAVKTHRPWAHDAVKALFQPPEGDLASRLELLLDVGEPADADLVRPLLNHEDRRVQALAGTFLLRVTDGKEGLDHAIQGLRADMPEKGLRILIRTLARHRNALVRRALADFEAAGASPTVKALRQLALARQGDSAATDKLPRYLFDPQGSYPRAPFLRFLAEARPNKIGVLTAILLESVALEEADALEALDVLERQGDARQARAVARLLSHRSSKVRARAVGLLRSWDSAEGAALLLRRPELFDARPDESARIILGEPGLVGTPVLPGLNLDLWLAGSKWDKWKKDVFPPATRLRIDGTFEAPSSLFDRAVVAFVVTKGNPAPESLVIDLRLNEGRRLTDVISLRKQGEIWVWIGRIPAGLVEAGTNRLRLRILNRTHAPMHTRALAVALTPQGTRGPRPLTGLDNRVGHLEARALPSRNGKGHRLQIQSSLAEGGRVEVSLEGEAILTLPLTGPFTSRLMTLALPTPLPKETPLILRFRDLPKEARATALLMVED